MAEQGLNVILQDLQKHLQNARVDVSNLSSIARNGDDKLVEKFLTETVFVQPSSSSRRELAESKAGVLQSQFYVACFWGFRDIIKGIIDLSKEQEIDVDINAQNPNTLWTPLHAATFQEHGPIMMLLLQNGAQPESKDSEGRTPIDFASASDKTWGHFAASGYQRTPKSTLVEMGIIRKIEAQSVTDSRLNPRIVSGRGIRMAAYSRPESAYTHTADPFINAALGGDVLANDDNSDVKGRQQPQFAIYK